MNFAVTKLKLKTVWNTKMSCLDCGFRIVWQIELCEVFVMANQRIILKLDLNQNSMRCMELCGIVVVSSFAVLGSTKDVI